MLDQVFAVANNSQETLFIKEDMGTLKEQNWGTNDKNNKRLMMVGQHSVPSPMTLTLRHQVGIRHRLLSLLHVQVAIRGKQDTKLVKARFFGRWRSRTVVGTVRELQLENERQRNEIERIRVGWNKAMQSFGH